MKTASANLKKTAAETTAATPPISSGLTPEKLTAWSCALSIQMEESPDLLVERAFAIWEAANQLLAERSVREPEYGLDGLISFAEIARQNVLTALTGKGFIGTNPGVDKAVGRCVKFLEEQISKIGTNRGVSVKIQKNNLDSLATLAKEISDNRKMSASFFKCLEEFQRAARKKESFMISHESLKRILPMIDLDQRPIVGGEL